MISIPIPHEVTAALKQTQLDMAVIRENTTAMRVALESLLEAQHEQGQTLATLAFGVVAKL